MKEFSNFLDDGLVITSVHEPMIFHRRTGRLDVHIKENWEDLHKEETVVKLKEKGLSLFRIHCHKGFGLEIEKEDREAAKKLTELCHKHGIKVQTYIAFQSAVSETTSVEVPDYEDWIMRDEHGKPITLWFNQQQFRNLPCHNRPGFWEYLKRATHAAIVDIKTDAIGYDNVSWSVEPIVCHCDACKKAFVEFLQKRYPTKEEAIERFGHAELQNIRPPVWNYYTNHLNLTEIRQPHIQEWIEFKTATLKYRINEMYDYCKSINPDVLVEINASMQTGQNSAFQMGIYQNDLAGGCDAFWNEVDPVPPGYRDGALLNRIRVFKSTQSMGKLIFSGHGRSGGDLNTFLLAVSESMTYQNGSLNCIGMLNQFVVNKNDKMPYMGLLNFSKSNRALYYAEPVPFVHMYESRASLCYSNFESHYACILMHQVLLRENIPYGVLHSLEDLSQCRTILLPGTMCLSEGEIDKLVSFVENGGSVVLTGNAGDYNEKYVGLAERSLRVRLGGGDKILPCAFSFGKGRVVIFPRLSSKHDFNTYDWTYNPFEENQIRVKFKSWEAPDNMRQVADAIRWTLCHDMPAVIKAPEALVSEMTRDGNNTYIHLLNYDTANPARFVTVTFREDIKKAELMFPVTGESIPLTVCGGNSIVVDEVSVYAIVKAEM